MKINSTCRDTKSQMFSAIIMKAISIDFVLWLIKGEILCPFANTKHRFHIRIILDELLTSTQEYVLKKYVWTDK
jgi:hypothetical protein